MLKMLQWFTFPEFKLLISGSLTLSQFLKSLHQDRTQGMQKQIHDVSKN